MKNFATDAPKDFALLIVGRSGSGKSTLAGRFPKPHFISLDHNLKGPAAQLAREGITDITYEDDIDRGPNGEELLPAVQFAKFKDRLSAAQASDRETIIIDNATPLNDLFCAEIMRMASVSQMDIKCWGRLVQEWKTFALKLRQVPKRVIILAHERVEKDEIDQSLKYFLAIPGQTSDLLPGYFTDVWRTEVVEELVNNAVVAKRKVRVVSNRRMEHLKSSDPTLPPVFEASQTEIAKILSRL
jgi:hypothetical protein